MDFLQPAWLWAAPAIPILWWTLRKNFGARWLAGGLILVAAAAEPVVWKQSVAPVSVVEFVSSPPEVPFRYVRTAAPQLLREGQKFTARLLLEATRDFRVRVRLFQEGLLVAEQTHSGSPGLNELRFSELVAEGPLVKLQWIIEEGEPSMPTYTLESSAVLPVTGPLHVLVLTDEPNPAIPSHAEGIRYRQLAVSELPADPAALQVADVFILADAVFDEWPTAIWNGIAERVRAGAGLLQCGGPRFARSAHGENERRLLLPLRYEPAEEREDARAVLVVLDRSGSMAQKIGDVPKMLLANQGALRVADALRPGDWFGVLAVDVSPLWVLPLAPWRDSESDRDAVRNIQPGGGGIYIDTALRAAWLQLRDAAPKNRLLLVFADADDIEEKAQGEMSGGLPGRSTHDLATIMRADRITISVVALGREKDKDTAWLRELAARGRGRFHRTEDARELPALFSLEAEEAGLRQSVFLPFFAEPTDAGLAVFRDMDWDNSPPLLDQNPAALRDGAEEWLLGKNGDPLLAVWRVGAGKVASLATSWTGDWAVEWDRWRDAGDVRGNLLEWLAPEIPEEKWSVEFSEAGESFLQIQISWLPANHPPPAEPPHVLLRRLGDGEQQLPNFPDWEFSGVGVWRAIIERPDEPLILEGSVEEGQKLPMAVWNPHNLPRPKVTAASHSGTWLQPIFLRPWLLGMLILVLAVTGPWKLRPATSSKNPGPNLSKP